MKRLLAALIALFYATAVLAGGTSGPPVALAVYPLGQSRIPFVLVSSGTMGNNGALSGITAVANAYPNAYVYMPAGAISSGSAAGWYYAVFSSTTAATVYNNSYSIGTPTIPASPTAFATTGPGAYTQSIGSAIASYTLSVAGNAIGPNGSLRTMGSFSYNNSASVKQVQIGYGSFFLGSANPTSSLNTGFITGFVNRQATNVQTTLQAQTLGQGPSSNNLNFGAVDTTQAQNFVVNLKLVTATDTMTLETVDVELIPGVP